MSDDWQKTICILCSVNCGVDVKLDGRHITRVRGNREHVASHGYACEKAQRIDYYQNGRDRLTSPLRRRADGTYEEIDWDTAIREVAVGFKRVRETYGGASIFYYGGGGQGNHLCGSYGGSTRRALGSVFSSNALAQEKTGEFWVDHKLFGTGLSGSYQQAEVAIFVGKNPWQSHGFQRARPILRDISADPKRALVVIDPRRTETAEMADYHLRVRPGTDAFCLAAILGVLVQEDLISHDYIRERTENSDELFAVLNDVPVAEYCGRAGLDEALVCEVARRIARASSVSVYEDLGIEQSLHSTLNSYLEKLLFAVTGNVGKAGGMNAGTSLTGLFSGALSSQTSPVGGHRIIGGMIPANVIPDEILTDHPKRFRAMLVEAENPAHSVADSTRMREALRALEFVVVIDVAMSETAREAHYVLPSSSQYEKWEATFFGAAFHTETQYANTFTLRAPILDAIPGTLPEGEIHRRLVRAMGAMTDDDVAPLHAAAAKGRAAYAIELMRVVSERPHLAELMTVVLYETLGPTLGAGNENAASVFGIAHNFARRYPESLRRAGFSEEGPALGNALFDAILTNRSGVVVSLDPYDETWRRIHGGRIDLTIAELMPELKSLRDEQPSHDPEFPFVLSAGQRRSGTANTIIRDPQWRPKDPAGALWMNPADAAALGIQSGGRVRITTKRASAESVVELTDTMLPGHVALPNGTGLWYPDREGQEFQHGVAPNELTVTEDRDWFAGTPFHKHVPARIEALA
ncbi:MAG TPA: molybdopterin-dependent oxidoreductase [Candidatus Acidoferrales bacterium]|jgi:anaerobic selenocysteine-containing dehydrogenase|nr:molybdopterin-dependent oxidoreductase [Candidatus Acidoferrales bacterium]